MTPAATPALPLLRADAPQTGAGGRAFAWARIRIGGLPLHFWTLQAYLFLLFSCVDEHWEHIFVRFRPRLAFGALTLVLLLGQEISGNGVLHRALRHRVGRWLAFFGVGLVFSTLWAFEPGWASDAAIISGTSMLSFFLIVLCVRTQREVLLTLLLICFASGIFLLLAVYEWKNGRYEYTQGVVRMLGAGTAYADPNSFGATLAFMLPVMAWVGTTSKQWWLRLCAIGFCMLTLYAVLKTSSRSALMLTGLVGVWALWYMPTRRSRVLYGLALVVGAVLFMTALSRAQVARIESIFTTKTYAKEESTAGRVEGYRVAWEMVQDRPLLGVGPGNWSPYRLRRIDGETLQPHNLVGQVAATRGAMGFIGFFGFLIATLLLAASLARRPPGPREGWGVSRARLAQALILGYVLLLVSGLGAHNVDRPNWFWMAGLLVVLQTATAEPTPEPVSRERHT